MESSLPSGIRDNYKRGSVGEFLSERIKDGSELSIVSAYFTIYAFAALKATLERSGSVNFLFGEPRFVQTLDPDKTDKKSFKIEDEGLSLANRLQQKAAAKECADWITDKVAIRSVKQSNLLHGKMYHIATNGVEDAIMGSSNFTVRGLGLGSSGNNIELNLVVDSSRDRQDLKAWFKEIWEDLELVEDVKDEVLLYLQQLYQNNDPEFIYYKTLYHIFEKFLAEQESGGLLDQNIKLVDSLVWNTLFEFQKDGVKGAINKLLKHNGCIIADSVGLGKTFEALAVIKYFELKNERVLVLCPKRLRENWTVYQAHNNSDLNPFVADRFAYTVLSHTDLSRDSGKCGDVDLASINWGNYDLVIIDESHNFRNNTKGRRDEDGNIVQRSRYERLMQDVMKAGVKTKVLLLSATPVNNDLKDLRNQLYIITEDEDSAFRDTIGVTSLKETLKTAQQQFSTWAKVQTQERKTSDLLNRLSSGFFKLLDELTIARSRKHIQKYYRDSVAKLGGFPERPKPVAIYSETDLKHKFMSYDKLNDEISGYGLSLFSPSKYVLPEHKTKYAKYETKTPNFTQADRENYLIGMMKVNFLKRLESSVSSFAMTLERTIAKIERLEEEIDRFQKHREENPDLDFDSLELDDDPEAREAFEVGQKKTYKLAHINVDDWLRDLRQDKQQLNGIFLQAKDVSVDRDAKLKELKDLISKKVSNPTINKLGQPNRKVLVFTAFADTAEYLYAALSQWALSDLGIQSAMVTGGSRENKTTLGRNEFNNILTNFSPVSKNRDKMKSMPQQGEVDLLIATDCISEGQNLQDCDYLINYDIHWNPVRIIQRFGRIDRIGSINTSVQLVNFWPTADLNKYINLKNRVEARMALVDIAATLEDNLLKSDDIKDLIADELKYRDKQLLRLKDEVLDMEDFSESVALNEFTLDDFRMELSKYIEANRQKLKDAPMGLYAVVPPDSSSKVIGPGIIFCLKQKADSDGTEAVNPLKPYFLVYVRDDKEVRFTFTQPKQILEIWRLLSSGKTVPYEHLCNLFDEDTCNGCDMTKQSELLTRAIGSVVHTFKRRTAATLQSGRAGVLVPRNEQALFDSDFELITWLVITAL